MQTQSWKKKTVKEIAYNVVVRQVNELRDAKDSMRPILMTYMRKLGILRKQS